MYVSSGPQVVALDADSGKEIWSYSAGCGGRNSRACERCAGARGRGATSRADSIGGWASRWRPTSGRRVAARCRVLAR